MSYFEKADFIIKTAVTAGAAQLTSMYIAATQLGQLFGRTVWRL